MEVLNGLGHGVHEKPYENGLITEFNLRGIPVAQQARYDINYKGHRVGEFVPDLIAYSAVVIDTKVIPHISDLERGQMMNYLHVTKLRVGVIINFHNPKLEWERIVL